MNLQRKQSALLLFGILAIALLVANGFVWFFRVDVSSAGAYRISDASRSIMSGLKAPVEITYYLSDNLRTRDPGFQQIADVVQEYAMASGGKVSVRVQNPEGMEQTLEQMGIQSRSMNVVDRSQVSQSLVYSGIVLRQLDKTQVIPFVSSPALVEYELGVQLAQLARGKPLVLGIMSGANPEDILTQFSIIKQELGRFVQVRDIQAGQEIPVDIDVLFLFRAEALPAEALISVEQFAMSGKGILIGADSYTLNLQYMMSMGPNQESPLNKMLASWGVIVEPSMLIAPEGYVQQFPLPSGNYTQMVPYPFWLNMVAEDANRQSVLGSSLQGLDLFWASPLRLAEGVSGEVIVSSVKESATVEGQIRLDPSMGMEVYDTSTSERKARALMVSRTGKANAYFSTQFPDKNLLANTETLQAIVVGDSEFASDLIQVTKSGYNVAFLQAALIWLGNDANLRQMTSRSAAAENLNKIRSPEGRAGAEVLIIFLNAVLVPLIIVGAGIIRIIWRKKLRKGNPA